VNKEFKQKTIKECMFRINLFFFFFFFDGNKLHFVNDFLMGMADLTFVCKVLTFYFNSMRNDVKKFQLNEKLL
jgi:hypothetical protein